MVKRQDAQFEGVRELVRAIGKMSKESRKELGQANKAIGQRIIDRAFPKPENVGTGAGSVPRASATTNVLRIMAGTTTRESHRQQWGKRYAPRDNERPYIRRSAEQNMGDAAKEYLDALLDAAKKAGIRTEEK
jgi:hypothetical protein